VPAEPLQGDLYLRADGALDGWCYAPDRPDERLVVELLVNDRVAVSMVAAMFRRDLLLRGCGDGYHGFLVRLPPNFPPAANECLITARERRSQRVFGRLLRPGPRAEEARLARLADEAAGLAAALGDLRARRAEGSRAAPLRVALGALACELDPTVSRRALVLPPVEAPRLTLGLIVADVATALRQIRALAPALADIGGEIVAIDPAGTAALLPARVRNLGYLQAPGEPAAALRAAAETGRGAWLMLAGAAPAPSAAALLALARGLPGGGRGVLVADALLPRADAPPAATLRLPASLGFALGCNRDLWRAAGPIDAAREPAAEALALRAHLLGVPLLRVAEPAARRLVRGD
jgi:hypothetical protein